MKRLLNEIEEQQQKVDLPLKLAFTPENYKRFQKFRNLVETHPLNEKRIERIDRRIALLEKQNNSHE